MDKDKVYTDLFNMVSSFYQQSLDDNGEATYIMDDEGRDMLLETLLKYFTDK